MKIFLVLGLFFFIEVRKPNSGVNSKSSIVFCDRNTEVINNYKDNSIKSLYFVETSKESMSKILDDGNNDRNVILYEPNKSDYKSSIIIDQTSSEDDFENEDNCATKVYLGNPSKDCKRFIYYATINTESSENDSYFSKPFQFCESQNKYMIDNAAKDNKNTHNAAWVALSLAIAALALVLLFVVYKFFC